MKYLIALSAFQAVLFGFFCIRVLEIDARTNDIAALAQADAAQIERPAADPYPADHVAVSGPTIGEFRQIIREEIAAFEDRLPVQSDRHIATGQTDNKTDNRSSAYSAADSLYLKASMHQDLDTYLGRGKIEPAEMANLQLQIARLPDEDRREMLTRLTKAMNAGELKGEF